jgi:regulator of cell morphogenesis and NO signaling
MSIQIDGNTTVRELIGRYPQTRKTFEKYGIDYCCGGGRCLAEAAQERRAALADLVHDIEAALVETSTRTATAEKDWYAAPLHELSDHILQVHHAYMHKALPRIKELVRKVLNAHEAHHGAMLRQVSDLYNALDMELTNHLRKEEEVLFPYIVAAETYRQGGSVQIAVLMPVESLNWQHLRLELCPNAGRKQWCSSNSNHGASHGSTSRGSDHDCGLVPACVVM